MTHAWSVLAALVIWIGVAPTCAQAQEDPYSAPYCQPQAGTKLLYSNRAYLIEPNPPDAPPLYYRYRILAPGSGQRHAERQGQLLFDEGPGEWKIESGVDELLGFWPLYPDKELALERVDRETGVRSDARFLVLGLEPIVTGIGVYRSWKIRRVDRNSDGTGFFQLLWYAPDICTLSAFTDSQHRMIRLLRILQPGERDYDRPLMVRRHHLYFADHRERVGSAFR